MSIMLKDDFDCYLYLKHQSLCQIELGKVVIHVGEYYINAYTNLIKAKWHFIISLLFSIVYFSLLQSGAISSSSAHHMCHSDEALALLLFKEMLHINASTFSSDICDNIAKMTSWNKSSADCCRWDGITCHEITGHVIALDLSCSRLMGVIHHNSTLFRLSRLQKLNLAFNNFSGSEISPNFGELTRLTHLNLSHSGFSGLVPPKISHLSKLVLLDLSLMFDLRFSHRDFHLLLQNLTHIRVLSLALVNISTTVPANWSSSLTYLDLGFTRIHGELSNSIFHLPRLQTLMLYFNINLTVGMQKGNYSINPSLRLLDLSYTNCSSEGILRLIGSLTSLKSLILSGCQLSGPFPNSIGNLSQIVQLNLRSNNFVGSIALIISNLPKLTKLDLGYNSFTGQFPSLFGNLTELTELDLEGNLLSGPLPSNISGLQKLRHLNLAKNAFEGTIPNSVLRLLNLSKLDLSSNNLSGSTEFAIFSSLTELTALHLSNNRLSLRIDNKIHISFPELLQLGLSSCEITEFPYFLKNAKNLDFLELSNNKLQGQIPDWIPCHSIEYLNLSHNSLSSLGPLHSLSLVRILRVLDLRSNKFRGPLPLFICNMKELSFLDLSYNKFTGTIPKCFGNVSSGLVVLNMANNDLKGAISMTFPKDNSLASLTLNGNSLEGPLPRSLANCKNMEFLDVANNLIRDTFPTFLENLMELQVLILKSNRFYGSLCCFEDENFLPNLKVVDLSSNEFHGVLPLKLLKSFKGMTNLDKIEAKASYMGNYMTSVGLGTYQNVHHDSMTFVMKGHEFEFPRISTTFVAIDLSSNNLTGGIPEFIGNLNSLHVLNLSHNKFSSYIPSIMGQLKFLESLDLSWNEIEGEILRQLVDLTSLAVLNLSQNHLVGCIPQGKQFNTFSNDSYYGNSGLRGLPVTKTCGEIDQPLPPSQGSNQQDEDSSFFSGFTLKSVLIGYGFGFAIGCLVFFTGKPKWLVRNIEEVYWHGFLWLGKKEIYKQLIVKSRRIGQKHYRRSN